jgi:hypothetical protein
MVDAVDAPLQEEVPRANRNEDEHQDAAQRDDDLAPYTPAALATARSFRLVDARP